MVNTRVIESAIRLPEGVPLRVCSACDGDFSWPSPSFSLPFASVSLRPERAAPLISLSDFQFGAELQDTQRSKRRRSQSFFSSISHTIDAKIRNARLKKVFNEIDEGHKGFLNEDDLEHYAERHGLPAEYIPAFMESALKGGHHQLRFDRFKVYVSGREESLKRTFESLDLDHDGRLTASEVEAGLSNFAFTCPFSRCVYRTKQQAVSELLSTLRGASGGQAGGAEPGIPFADFRRFFLLLPRTEMLVDYWLRASCPSACDIGARVLMRDDTAPAKGSPWNHLTAGAVAGMASRTAVAPLETLRLQAMVGAAQGASLLEAGRCVVRQSGWGGLYKGNLVSVLHSAPQKALSFFAFDAFKGLLRAGEAKSALPIFVAAGLAGATASATLYPLDVVRSRLMCDTVGRYRNMGHALTTIVRQEGVPALYRGLSASILSIIPEAAITYGLFDILKKGYVQATGEQEAGVVPSIGFGVFSAFTGQLVAYPLETVVRQMQVRGGGPGSSGGLLSVLQDIVRRGGPAALYKGVGAASLRVFPMAVVSFGTYEWVRIWLLERENLRRTKQALRIAAAEEELLSS